MSRPSGGQEWMDWVGCSCAISAFGRIDGPSIPPLRQQFWALGFHTALLWLGQVSGLVIRCYSNVIPKFDTL